MRDRGHYAIEGPADGDVLHPVRHPAAQLRHLHLVTAHDVEALRNALAKDELPPDFAAKLARLADESLIHRCVEQNCHLFIALLLAAKDGALREATPAQRERLLRVLAYVRKDDDAIPDYKPDGFTDDQREMRAATVALEGLIQRFK